MTAQANAVTTVLGPTSLLGRSQKVGLEYVLRIDPDRLLAPVCHALGKAAWAKAPNYGGWESRQIAGHSLGHYLSALSGFWEDLRDPRVKEKLDYVVSELKALQREDGYLGGVPSEPFDKAFSGDFEVENFGLAGYWVPWYSVHKIYAGLIDAFSQGGNQDALQVVCRMADWAARGASGMTEVQFQRMLACEHGGMSKSLADLYGITGETRFLELSERFIHHAVVDSLMDGVDTLQGLHANTQIPKLIGLAKLYELTGNLGYRKGVETFFETVTGTRSYVIGGNSLSEHFGPRNLEPLGRDTCETCNTYNMMELAEHLFTWTGDSKYADYYEQAQLNHILASQDPVTGAKMYFVSTDPGHFKVYGTEDDSFWCCTGTGMENPERYNRFVAVRREGDLHLNLFAEATVNDPGLGLRIATDYPPGTRVTVTVLRVGAQPPRLLVRRPGWLGGPLEASVNTTRFTREAAGYLVIDTVLKAGDEIVFDLPMGLREIASKDDPHKVSVAFGPLVLAAELGTAGFPATDAVGDHLSLMGRVGIPVPPVLTDAKDPSEWLKLKDPGTLTFETAPGVMGQEPVLFRPFYALHHQRYTLYLDRYLTTDKVSQRFLSRDQKFEDVTRDVVKIGQQQSEVDHGFQAAGSFMGYLGSLDLNWRDARGEGAWFAYRMKFAGDGKEALQVTYFDKDGPIPRNHRRFNILVAGRLLAAVEWKGSGQDCAVDVGYPVPAGLLGGLPAEADGTVRAEVRFETQGPGTYAGGVLEIRVVKTT